MDQPAKKKGPKKRKIQVEPIDESPIESVDEEDPGDDTQRRFRYQHSYGVILAVAMINQKKPWVAVWCEQHEDFLVERGDGRFQGFQIKTRLPQIGAWTNKDEAFLKSIGRFVSLDTKFPDRFYSFHFVSNCPCEAGTKDKLDLSSPLQLMKAINAADVLDDLAEPFKETCRAMAKTLGVDPALVFSVLRKLEIVEGPSLEDCDSVIAHQTISELRGFESQPARVLDAARDELIGLIFRASSLAVDDPGRFLMDVSRQGSDHPQLRQKRISAAEALDAMKRWGRPTFRFAPSPHPIKLPDPNGNHDVLEKKLNRGGLGNYVDSMRRRTLSAEQHLLEISYRQPEEIEAMLNHLDGVMSVECADAQLEASETGSEYGLKMMRILMRSTKARLEKEPESVFGLSYDCLVGIVGILTNECKVWWSEKFDPNREE